MTARIVNLLIFGVICTVLNKLYGFTLFSGAGALFLTLMGVFYLTAIAEYKSTFTRGRYFLIAYEIKFDNDTHGGGSVTVESTKGFPSQEECRESIEKHCEEQDYGGVEGIVIVNIYEFKNQVDYTQYRAEK